MSARESLAEVFGEGGHGDNSQRFANELYAKIRAEVLREAADDCDEAGAAYTARALNDQAGGAFALMEHFQRKANEAEYAATPCDFVACEPGGEPCSTHERLMAHAEGDHELCAPNCGTTADGMADEAVR